MFEFDHHQQLEYCEEIQVHRYLHNLILILELGVPHNALVADGNQIQTSAYRAIKNGIKINDIFSLVKDFKKSKKK